ncbi:hypothetical protein [Streptomyces monomycini]|uniref:hypothetical protein n=1 Tax=Streptomyces monomycini TaxID=371720 RepID=UPI0004AA80AB|nr:hypothetical protein [Streptomyces monomycini]
MKAEPLLNGRCWRGCEPTAANPAVFVGPGDFCGLYVPLFLCGRHRQRLQERSGSAIAGCSLCEAIDVPVDRVGENTSVLTSVRRWPDGRSVVIQWVADVALYGCLPCQEAVQEAVFKAAFRDRGRYAGIARRPPISAA